VKLPAVSGSSGRLVVERGSEQAPDPSYPGQVFGELARPYAEVMQAFVAAHASAAETAPQKPAGEAVAAAEELALARAVRHEQAELRASRRQVRAQRTQEDAAWRTLLNERRTQEDPVTAPLKRGAQAAQ